MKIDYLYRKYAGSNTKQIILIAMVTASLLACSDKQASTAGAAADIEAGKKIASQSCVGCHGMDGQGVTDDIPHLAAQFSEYLVLALQEYKEGKRAHAALKDIAKGMSNSDSRSVAAYYAGLPPAKKTTARIVTLSPYEKGEAAASVCVACHGENGNSQSAGIPSLAGQQPMYFISVVHAYLSGGREFSSTEKETMVNALNKVDIEAMALFYASQTANQRQAPPVGDSKAGEPLTANCGGCHGAQGISSDAKVPTLASQDAVYLVNAIQAYRDEARQQDEMHNFLVNSKNTDIENMAAYYSVQKSRPAQSEPILVQELAQKCDRCHGPGTSREGAPIVFPKIDGQNRGYLIKALREYREDQRESSAMHKMSLPYSDAIIESVADLYANRPAN